MVSEASGGGRVAYLAADLDRRYLRELLPDHGKPAGQPDRGGPPATPFRCVCAGPGLIDCHLYRQEGRLILHLVNLTSANTWRAPIDELIAVGPLHVAVKIPRGVGGRTAKALVSTGSLPVTQRNGWAELTVRSILDHEVVVLS